MDTKWSLENRAPKLAAILLPGPKFLSDWFTAGWRRLSQQRRDGDVEADLLRPRCCRNDRTEGFR
jgi:hypothetical protein